MQARDRCPGCLSTALSTLYEEPYSGPGVTAYLQRHYEGRASNSAGDHPYELAHCRDCSLVFQKYVPDGELLDEIYNRWIPQTTFDDTDRDYSLDQYRYLAEQVQFMLHHFDRKPSELNVLDFGFGWAQWSRMAMAFGCNVSGVELSDERKNYGKSVGMQVVELDQLPEGGYDFIHTEQVVEHLTEPRGILLKLAASLKPEGILKISVPDSAAALKKIGQTRDFGALAPGHQMPIAPLEHVNSFTHDSLVSVAASLGLKPLRPSFYQLYNSASGLLEPKEFLRVALRPFYRHVFPRSTFVYFTRG